MSGCGMLVTQRRGHEIDGACRPLWKKNSDSQAVTFPDASTLRWGCDARRTFASQLAD
jgi:hypothetical protein